MKNKIGLILLAAGMSVAMNAVAKVQLGIEKAATQQRIHMLEIAFYPNEPDSIAKLYAKAAMERNGAVQFMVLSPELRQKFRATLEDLNWVTGASNPKILSYSAVNIERAANLWKFAVHFTLSYAGNHPYSCINHIEVGQVIRAKSRNTPVWAITQLDFLDPAQACQPKPF
jgi:hypothetical protein